MRHDFSVISDFLPNFVTDKGNCMREYCNLRLAAKLKMKSSNSSSAVLGIGDSVMIVAMVSTTAMLSESVVATESTAAGFLSLQPTDEKQNMLAIMASTIRKAPFLITNYYYPVITGLLSLNFFDAKLQLYFYIMTF